MPIINAEVSECYTRGNTKKISDKIRCDVDMKPSAISLFTLYHEVDFSGSGRKTIETYIEQDNFEDIIHAMVSQNPAAAYKLFASWAQRAFDELASGGDKSQATDVSEET